MIEHVWTILCERAFLDESQNISLISVVEQLSATAPPIPEGGAIFIPFKCEVVSSWRRTTEHGERGRCRMIGFDSSGDEFVRQEMDINLVAYTSFRSRIKIIGLPVRQSGTFSFVVDIWDEAADNWRQVESVPLRVRIDTIAGEPSTTTPSSVDMPTAL